MNSEIKMSVSSMTKMGDKKGAYVLFTDGNSNAEFLSRSRKFSDLERKL